LGFGTTEETEGSSDPFSKSSVGGRDFLNAAKDAYVYRVQGDGNLSLLKMEKGLYLRVLPEYVQSPEMQEVAPIFRLTPGLSAYQIKPELSEEANRSRPSPLGSDTIYLNLRSVLQIMTFLVAVHSLGLSFANDTTILPAWHGRPRFQSLCGRLLRQKFRRRSLRSSSTTNSAVPNLRRASMISRIG
jgi:hypothetical protein